MLDRRVFLYSGGAGFASSVFAPSTVLASLADSKSKFDRVEAFHSCIAAEAQLLLKSDIERGLTAVDTVRHIECAVCTLQIRVACDLLA
jgi:hypothetical protein